jgi:hypothetical protein
VASAFVRRSGWRSSRSWSIDWNGMAGDAKLRRYLARELRPDVWARESWAYVRRCEKGPLDNRRRLDRDEMRARRRAVLYLVNIAKLPKSQIARLLGITRDGVYRIYRAALTAALRGDFAA